MAVTQQEIENRLWDAADELRVAMPEAQYSSVVFPLMFWKYLSDTWEHQHQEFLADNEGLDGLSAEEAHEIEYRDYQSFEIPFIYPGTVKGRRASWSSILATITQPGLGQRVRASLQAIETANPDKFSRLFGSMTWTSEEVLSGEVLAAVMQAMDRIPKMHEGNMSHDVLGGAYEYLLKRFSDGSGTRAGQFFTPREVVELLVEVLDPKGFESVYDPTCGSGGMLIASANLLKARGGRGYTLSLYGQEAVPDTAGVARMNLFMHNLTQFQVEVGDTLKDPRFKKPNGSVATFDVIVANPPYSLKWKPWTNDPRAIGGVAPQSSADWAFVQHMIASDGPEEGARRRRLAPRCPLPRRPGSSHPPARPERRPPGSRDRPASEPLLFDYHPDLHPRVPCLRDQGRGAPGRGAVHRRLQAVHQGQESQHPHRRRHRRRRDRLPARNSTPTATRWTPTEKAGSRRGSSPPRRSWRYGYDLNIGRYIKQAAAEQEDLGTLIDAYNLARAERQKTEQRMLAVLAAAGIEGFDE